MTSVDTAATALEERSYFLRRIGTDGFRISYRPTIKKVVNDRRASLDEEGEIRPAIRKLVKEDFDTGHAEADARGSGSRRGVDGRNGRRRAQPHWRVDARPRGFTQTVSGRAHLGGEEGGARAA